MPPKPKWQTAQPQQPEQGLQGLTQRSETLGLEF
jgi:hypothetical protein